MVGWLRLARGAAGVLIVGLAGLLGTALWTWQGARPRQGTSEERPLEGLKVFGAVPDFSLVERSGKRIVLADLRGKVWIANFIYTHCPDTCPLQTAQMALLQKELAAERNFRLVSISVDPERDTPAVLSEYAERFGADPDRWLFLTGEKRTIYRLALEGFRLSVVDPEEGVQGRLFGPAPALADLGQVGKTFIHSSRFVLMDRRARIRGYYQFNDVEAMGRLVKDVTTLLREH
ncbi:MAG TPA: SCO family protein [Candidatus Methylomirabilis sp.]|jgi:protein SCO1/2|nr:SCO family protein [Candidatus Methylomirabilis sp.]